MESEAVALLKKADSLCTQAETRHKWNLIVEANALRARGKQKRKEADDAKKEAEVIAKKVEFAVEMNTATNLLIVLSLLFCE